MPVLLDTEYDNAYFDPNTTDTSGSSANSVLAGYSNYQRWFRTDVTIDPLGTEFYKDIAKQLETANALQSKSLLDIGCAKGYLVADLRDLGVQAYGIDVSAYAIAEGLANEPSLTGPPPQNEEYIRVFDGRNLEQAQSGYKKNEFNVVLSRWFFCCLNDSEIAGVVSECNRITKTQQIHFMDETPNPDYYNVKTMTEWLAYDWDAGTILINIKTGEQVVK